MSISRTASIAIAKRYATAIFDLASQGKNQATIAGEMRALANAMKQSPELTSVIKNPLVSRSKKAEILQALMAKASKLTQESVGVLATQGRAEVLPYLADALDEMLAAHEGTVVAQVVSARPLSANVQKQLRDSLADITGREVKLNMTQDESVLGGFAVRVGSHLLDATLSGALANLRTKLLVPTQ